MGVELTKTAKKPEDFEGEEPTHEARLEMYDKRKNHNKFWRIRVYGRYIVREWGRHGSKGQSSVHSAWNAWGAQEAFYDLKRQKRNKGYVEDQTTVLDHMAREIG